MHSQRPIQVYLDSQEISRLSDPSNANRPETIERLNRLLSYKDSGLVEFRFSMVHISEMSATNLQAVRFAQERAKIFTDLTGACALIDMPAIFEYELAYFLSKYNSGLELKKTEIAISSNNGRWLSNGNIDLNIKFLKESMRSSCDADFGKGAVSRAARRETFRRAAKQKTFDGFPLDEKFQTALRKTFMGTAREGELDEAALDQMRTPMAVFELMDRWPTFWKVISGSFRHIGEKTRKGLEISRENATNLRAPFLEDQRFRQMYRDRLKKAPTSVKRELAAQHVEQNIEAAKKILKAKKRSTSIDSGLLANITFDDLPCAHCYFEATAQLLIEAFSANETPRPFDGGDAGDTYHFAYLPYVDIFQCDKRFASLATQLGNTYETLIVGKPNDLLPRIEQALAARQLKIALSPTAMQLETGA